jgi:hypothetical protein
MFKPYKLIEHRKNMFFYILSICCASATFAQFTNSGGESPPPPFFINEQGDLEYGQKPQPYYYGNPDQPPVNGDLPQVTFNGNPAVPGEGDDPAAPINEYYWVLLLLGAGLGAFQYNFKNSANHLLFAPINRVRTINHT